MFSVPLRGPPRTKKVLKCSPRLLPPCTANPAPRPCSPYVPRSARNPPAPSPAASELPVPQSPSTPPATGSGYPRPPPHHHPQRTDHHILLHTRPAQQQRQNQHQPAQQHRPWIVSYLHCLRSLARHARGPWGWRSPPNAELHAMPHTAHMRKGNSLPTQRIHRFARIYSSK